MKTLVALTLWLGTSSVILWWLHRQELVPEDQLETMMIGSATVGALAAALVWSGVKARARTRSR